MKDFPVEVIEKILACPELSIQDVINFSMTCSYNRNIVLQSNLIWKPRFAKNWPQFINLLDATCNNWFEEFKYITDLNYRTRKMLATMSPRFHKQSELSDCDLVEWSELCKERRQTFNYLTDYLMRILKIRAKIPTPDVIPLTYLGNKTMQYYAQKVLRYLKQHYVRKKWEHYMSLPEEQQILEKGAFFVAQWCQPQLHLKYSEFATELDGIAAQVKEYLKAVNPDHPVFNASAEDLELWRRHNLEDNQWDSVRCKEIIAAMEVVLYQHLGFKGNYRSYYRPENSYINEVLKERSGIPITLAIVYESIARRLGLKCCPISFPEHFLLRFSEGRGKDFRESDWYYIDVFNEGKIIRRNSCPYSHQHSEHFNEVYPIATAQQVVERMTNNLEFVGRNHADPNGQVTIMRSCLELQQLVSKNDTDAIQNLAKLYMLHGMDTKPLIYHLMSETFEGNQQAEILLRTMQEYERNRKKNLNFGSKPAERTPFVQYAVGMILNHINLNYRCLIYDWDPVCLASHQWQVRMKVHNLKLKDRQPFYKVIVDDGSHRYVAQENLHPTFFEHGYLEEFPIEIEDIGRHFTHFYITHYVPNAEKEREYPGDGNVRHMYHQKVFNSEDLDFAESESDS